MCVAALAGCSDSEQSDTTETISEPGAAGPSSDQELADQAVLTADDLGTGWAEQPRSDDGDDPESDALFGAVVEAEPACAAWVAVADEAGLSVSEFEIAPEAPIRAESATLLVEPDLLSEVEHTVSVYPTADEATASFEAVRSAELLECLTAAFDDIMQASFDANSPGLTVSDFRSTVLSSDLGDEAMGGSYSVTIGAPDGSTADINMDMTAIRSGRVVSAVYQYDFEDAIDDPDAIVSTALQAVIAAFNVEE